ncbi:MAG: primosomal protein N' [Duncaniella sp.]|nr:primosomal protein N' [Duncaniella sp.]
MFASVLVPVPIAGSFTYSVPDEMLADVSVGVRVIVPFGGKKLYTGIVTALSPVAPEGVEVKSIVEVIDGGPVVRHPQLKFWNWIADYYLSTPGEVYRAALPTGLKIESETFISAITDFEEDPASRLTDAERRVMDTLLTAGEKKMTLDSIAKKSGVATVGAVANRLLAKGAVRISENLVERYHPRTDTYVRLTCQKGDNEGLQRAFDSVRRGSMQEKALLAMVELSEFMRLGKSELREVTRNELIERTGVTTAVVSALAKKGVVEIYKKTVDRFFYGGTTGVALPDLTIPQRKALGEIEEQWKEKDIVLLHGVTSSGKTEIYMRLIDAVLGQGLQTLYLVPEIALTTQLTSRLKKVFGDKVVIYHSRYSDRERVEIWNRLLHTNEPLVIIGARSSLFLPFARLGLIIVDEEHESAFKQFDPSPRYNARDAAMVLASMHGAKTLLGSATPAVETYYKALHGRFGLVTLGERYQGIELPEMELVDMTDARRRGLVHGIFADETRDLVARTIAADKQAIVFLNRRGYAPIARCSQCGYVPKCDKCDVSLTYHRLVDRLVCHYCGTPYAVPRICPACKEPSIEVLGYGTERLEDEVDQAFPGVSISRMDLDTTRNKHGYETLIEEFSKGRTQILVGTQMVTKGLDFGGVSTVVVANADTVINQPDFRASERGFCMLEQVAGRAGRKGGRGKVAIQTWSPSHPIFPFVLAHDYEGFYNHEISERERYAYPPFSRVVFITLRSKDQSIVTEAARIYAERLRELLGSRVSGPDTPAVSRVNTWYLRRVMLKIEPSASMTKVKELLRELRITMTNEKLLAGTQILYDVDPM